MYNHMDAFKVMSYTCRLCTKVWVIWNSRDGIAPYATPCPCCEGELATRKDYRAGRSSEILPTHADFVLVDMDETQARRLAQGVYDQGARRFEERIEAGVYTSREDLLQQLTASYLSDDARPVRVAVADYTCGLAAP